MHNFMKEKTILAQFTGCKNLFLGAITIVKKENYAQTEQQNAYCLLRMN